MFCNQLSPTLLPLFPQQFKLDLGFANVALDLYSTFQFKIILHTVLFDMSPPDIIDENIGGICVKGNEGLKNYLQIDPHLYWNKSHGTSKVLNKQL